VTEEPEGIRYLLAPDVVGVPLLVRSGPADVVRIDDAPRQPALIAAIAADLRGYPTRLPLNGRHSIACTHHVPPGPDRRPLNDVALGIARELGARGGVQLRGPVVFTAAPERDGLLRSLFDHELAALHLYAPRAWGAR
jgi:hypothetical protein